MVGTTFRAPPAQDKRGWEELRRLLDEGERFMPCPSVEEYEEMTVEGRRRRIRAMQDAEWHREKTKRITILKNEENSIIDVISRRGLK